MTFTGDSRSSRTPEQILASRKWRYLNSWWVMPPILSLGFLGWLGFLVAAIRTGKKYYWIFTGVYALALAVGITLITIDSEGVAGDLAILPILGCWLVPTIHAAAINRRYLTALAAASAAKSVWYAAPAYAPEASKTPVEAPFLGIDRNDFYSPNARGPAPQDPTNENSSSAGVPTGQGQALRPTSSIVRLNANTLTVEGLASLPGVSPALAHRIVAVRDARGGYRDIDDLTAAANLQPHELLRIRNHLTFDADAEIVEPRHSNPAQHGGTGRILDL